MGAIWLAVALAGGGHAASSLPLLLLQASHGGSGRRQQSAATATPKPAARQPAAKKPAGKPARPAAAARGPSGQVQLHCQGNVNYYGMFGNYYSTDQFEFRTVLDWTGQTHRVALVVKGPLFITGTTYSLLGFGDDVARLAASSTKTHVLIDTVLLDTRTGKLAGTGEIRGTLTRSQGNIGRRRAEVDGLCEQL